MIPSETMKILNVWNKNIFGELSISEIMRRTGKKTKPWVFNGLKKLSKANLIIQKRKGNINLYALDIRNPLLIQTLQFIEAQKAYNFSKLDIMRETIDKVPVNCYCLVVFGSYAEGKQTKESDLDVCFLIEDETVRKKIKPYFNDIKLSSTVDIDEHYITFSDFVRMLLREEENLGKQVFRNHRIFFCSDIYYKLIMEAYKNGFRP
ncbi:nucleotidyltransferase domain-containing protein [archaeon]|nr:nucleotidyltransferase domain-containing protein [archaeon]